MKNFVKKRLNQDCISKLRSYRVIALGLFTKAMYPYGRYIKTPICLMVNNSNLKRKLEIGPGPTRINEFETINVVWGKNVDYIGDASKKLPFKSDVFDIVYGSHVLEHIPWYKLNTVLLEWVRVVKPGGQIEIWVPNGLLIAETFVNAENGISNNIELDGWYKFNEDRDPCVWANGRTFSYGDGSGNKNDPNWHLAIFSPRYLQALFERTGLMDVEFLDRSEVRGNDHGWINLGIRGRKP